MKSATSDQQGAPLSAQNGQKGKDNKRIWFILVAGISLLLLLLGDQIPSLWGERQESEKQSENAKATEANSSDDLTRYAENLRAEMKQLCESVAGAGEVQVAVSFDGGFTYLYAADNETQRDGDGKEQIKEAYLTVGSGTSEKTVLLTSSPPAIRGIGVVCRGGANAQVRAEIISLLSATYGIGSNRIYVAAGEK